MTDEPMKVVLPAEPASNRPNSQGPGPVRRFLRGLVRLLLALLIIGGVAAAGYYVFQQLQRSLGTQDSRLDVQSQQLEAVQTQLEARTAELEAVQATITGLDARLAGNLGELETAVQGSTAAQDETLAALTRQMAAAAAAAQAMDTANAGLSEGQATLQADISGLRGTAEAQSDEIAALQGGLEAAQTNEAALAETVDAFREELRGADPAALRQAVLVFRLWELVARARLRLVENNLGLAEDDVKLSLEALALLSAGGQQGLVERLGPIEERLLMAQENLPDAPLPAANDLDLAWQDLDEILGVLLVSQTEGTPEAEVTPEPEVTAEPGATPEPTVIPELEVTPEPSATPA